MLTGSGGTVQGMSHDALMGKPPEPRTPGIMAGVAELDKACERLGGCIARLEARIQPVLSSGPDAPGAVPQPGGPSELAADLAVIYDRVCRMANYVETVADRVTL